MVWLKCLYKQARWIDQINNDIVVYGLWEEVSLNLLPYYQNRGIENASGQDLRDLLKTRLYDGIDLKTYGGNLNDTMKLADQDPNDATMVNLIYDNFPMSKTADGASGTAVWNKEHVVPKSWYNNQYPRHVGDVHNLRISNTQTNSYRSNRMFADSSGKWERIGSDYFYPGDVARIVMYMMVMLPDVITESKVFGNANGIMILNTWHNEDPVDAFELRRNDVLYNAQGNRNPFIDHPEMFDLIWNNTTTNLYNQELNSYNYNQLNIN